MKYFIALLVILSFCIHPLSAQKSFVEQCLGEWEGMMYIYSEAQLVDSVATQFTASRTEDPAVYTWKTTYLSEKTPMVKDYQLKVLDAKKQIYATDEGNGLLLNNYLFGKKMYSVFETQGILLTASYELLGEHLIFEVTSGTNLEPGKEVMNYSVRNLQRVVFRLSSETRH
jgi:hypothetical protein